MRQDKVGFRRPSMAKLAPNRPSRYNPDMATMAEAQKLSSSLGLADVFYAERRRFMLDAAERPGSFSIREREIRRVKLQRFPYHFLFRTLGDAVRVLGGGGVTALQQGPSRAIQGVSCTKRFFAWYFAACWL